MYTEELVVQVPRLCEERKAFLEVGPLVVMAVTAGMLLSWLIFNFLLF
jgi:hypothetical protein